MPELLAFSFGRRHQRILRTEDRVLLRVAGPLHHGAVHPRGRRGLRLGERKARVSASGSPNGD